MLVNPNLLVQIEKVIFFIPIILGVFLLRKQKIVVVYINHIFFGSIF
jgi:hypothetical protein